MFSERKSPRDCCPIFNYIKTLRLTEKFQKFPPVIKSIIQLLIDKKL
jgi:hypothetical protein